MSQVDELRNFVEKYISPDDIIGALISQFDLSLIQKDTVKLHKAVSTLKSNHPEMFEAFIFDYSGLSPFSDLLERTLQRFESNSIFGTVNPNYAEYCFRDKAIEEIKKLSKFSDVQKETIKAISKEFKSLI